MLVRMWLQGAPMSVRGLLGASRLALSWCACLASLIGLIGSSGCMEADRRLALALGHLDNLSAPAGTTSDLAALARYVVERDR